MPKAKQATPVTKTAIIQNINPVSSNINITKVFNVRDGGIIVRCENSDECIKFKKFADEKLANDYTIKEVPVLNSRFKIVGISENLSENDFINVIKNQNKNEICPDSNLKVISQLPLKKNNKLFQVIIQSYINSYQKVNSLGKLFVGCDYCNVFNAIEAVLQVLSFSSPRETL
ncbi:unnamed protein product [Psylliodes chrysocephalus]|uniref:Uncharacterized protein n=1 Tax=Psylliodes chrysocephalus TaxID=3402493 RepID=A0A9P0CPS5_9CUCU|nr:unnamed protein product [Psylliodes chrysocephala]